MLDLSKKNIGPQKKTQEGERKKTPIKKKPLLFARTFKNP